MIQIPVLHPEAACKGAEVTFFVGTSARKYAAAAAICKGCPERAACLQGAVERGEEYGVWGGANFENAEHRRLAEVGAFILNA